MANEKISQLGVATTVEGAILPVVQDGTNKQLDVGIVGGYVNSAWYGTTESESVASNDALAAAAEAALVANGGPGVVYVPHRNMRITSNLDLGDVVLLADDCALNGGGYPQATSVRGFRQSGIFDSKPPILPSLPTAGSGVLFYKQSAGTMWAVQKKPTKGGIATRLQQTTGTSVNSIGTPWQRFRQSLVYDLTMAWCCVNTRSAESGSWTDDAMVASRWAHCGTGTNLFQVQPLRRSQTATEYCEFSVTTDENGEFNVGFYMFVAACDAAEVKDQTNNIVIATEDLRSGSGTDAVGYVIRKYKAPKRGTFTLRITNSGSGTADLRILGVNFQQLVQGTGQFNTLQAYDYFNFIRNASGSNYVANDSEASTVYSARVGSDVVSGGGFHGGETSNEIVYMGDGTVFTPADGDVKLVRNFQLRQKTTITWSDGQTLDHFELATFSQDGRRDIDWNMYSEDGVLLSNLYGGMAPITQGFTELEFPQFITLAAAGVADASYNPAINGENSIILYNPTTGQRVRHEWTLYPELQQIRGYPGGVNLLMGTTSDAYLKVYHGPFLGARTTLTRFYGRHNVTYM